MKVVIADSGSANAQILVDNVVLLGLAAPTIAGLTADQDTGTVGDNRTISVTPSISGTSSGYDAIGVYLDGSDTPIGTTGTVGANGAWRFDLPTALAPGNHGVTV